MGKKVSRRITAAFVFSGEGLYFVRDKETGALGLPCIDTPRFGEKRALVKHFREAYGVEAYIVRKLPQIVVCGHPGVLVQAYQLDVELPKETERYEFVLLEEWDKDIQTLDPIHAGAAKRGFVFLPFYTQHIRTVPLLEKDQERAYWQLECLRYFRGKKVPRAEIYEFEGLISSASSVRRINEAFAMICNRYQANPNTYVKYLEYREKRREALK